MKLFYGFLRLDLFDIYKDLLQKSPKQALFRLTTESRKSLGMNIRLTTVKKVNHCMDTDKDD